MRHVGNTHIWKFEVSGHTATIMPHGAEVLDAKMIPDRSEPFKPIRCFIWALVSPQAETVERHFHLVATGKEIPQGVVLRHVATMALGDGREIWHLFEEPE